MTGEGIPFRKLGFDSLGSFLETLSDTLIVRRLPTGGMMVALAGTGQQRTAANNKSNLKGSRNISNPKNPIRRPKQQSINWTPPTKQQNRSKENLHKTNNRSKENLSNNNNQVKSNGHNKSKDNIYVPPNSRKSGTRNDAAKPALRQPKQQTTPNNNKPPVDKNGSSKAQAKKSSKTLLEEYFKRKNLGPLTFKIATMGNKGKERFIAHCYMLVTKSLSIMFQIFSHNHNRQCTVQDLSTNICQPA